jgi:hypothetical protein
VPQVGKLPVVVGFPFCKHAFKLLDEEPSPIGGGADIDTSGKSTESHQPKGAPDFIRADQRLGCGLDVGSERFTQPTRQLGANFVMATTVGPPASRQQCGTNQVLIQRQGKASLANLSTRSALLLPFSAKEWRTGLAAGPDRRRNGPRQRSVDFAGMPPSGTGFAEPLVQRRNHAMLHQDGNARRYRRQHFEAPRPPYEASYLMKLGNLSLREAKALVEAHGGDRFAINAELIARRNRPSQ